MQFDDWLKSANGLGVIDPAERAALAWRRISDSPSSVILTRKGTQLTAQTVRLESNNNARQVSGPMETIGRIYLTVFGIQNHATRADTDIQRSDRFSVGKVEYEVVAIATPPGEVQAYCEGTRAS